jgi:hypothetical protein
MTNDPDDLGVISALLERLNNQRLPRLLDIKQRVDAGGRLDSIDMQFLGEVATSAEQVRTLAPTPGISRTDRPGDRLVQGNHGQGAGERTERRIA